MVWHSKNANAIPLYVVDDDTAIRRDLSTARLLKRVTWPGSLLLLDLLHSVVRCVVFLFVVGLECILFRQNHRQNQANHPTLATTDKTPQSTYSDCVIVFRLRNIAWQMLAADVLTACRIFLYSPETFLPVNYPTRDLHGPVKQIIIREVTS